MSVSPQRLKRPFCNKFIKDLKKKHSGPVDQNFIKETIASKNKQKAVLTKTTLLDGKQMLMRKQGRGGLNNTQSMSNLHLFANLQAKVVMQQTTPSNQNRLASFKNFNEDEIVQEDMKEDHLGKNLMLKDSAQPHLIHGMKQSLSNNAQRKMNKTISCSFVNLQSEKLNQRRNLFKEKKMSQAQHIQITIMPTTEEN